MSGQKRFYMRWLEALHSARIMNKFKAISSIFSHSSSSMKKTLEPILLPHKKAYTLQQIEQMQSFFSKVISVNKTNIKKTIHIIHKVCKRKAKNHWFKKAAEVLALKTKINTQKSFWRLKFNRNTPGNVYSVDMIIKLKKLFNIVRKKYELDLYKVFLTIN